MTASDSPWILPAGRPVMALGIYALIWNLFGWHAAVSAYPDLNLALAQGKYGVLMLLVVPLLGMVLAVWFVQTAWLQHRFGKSRLCLQPCPALTGKPLAGEIRMNRTLPPDSAISLTCQCVHAVTGRRGRNSRKAGHTVIWQTETGVRTETGEGGTTLHFALDLPADMPATSLPARDWHFWRLSVRTRGQTSGADLDFEIPVQAIQPAAKPRPAKNGRKPPPVCSPELEQLLRLQRQGNKVHFELPYGRGRSSAFMLGLAGLVFVSLAGFVVTDAQDAATTVTGSLFGLAGVFMLTVALYLPFNRLQVAIDDHNLYWRRHWLNLPLSRRQLAIADLKAVAAEEQRSLYGGNRFIRYFRVAVITRQRKTVTLADALPGQMMADELVRFLLQHSPLKRLAPMDEG